MSQEKNRHEAFLETSTLHFLALERHSGEQRRARLSMAPVDGWSVLTTNSVAKLSQEERFFVYVFLWETKSTEVAESPYC